MQSDRGWSRALEIAHDAANLWADRPKFNGQVSSIVAGRQFDLSGITACSAEACLQRELDEGLAPVWQYFDQVVVEGLSARMFLARSLGVKFAKTMLNRHAMVYLHARKIGALPYLVFQEKPHAFCANHYKEHAKELGLPAALDGRLARSIIKKLATEGELEIDDRGGANVDYFFTHPLFEAGLNWIVPRESLENEPITPEVMARSMYTRACLAAVGDTALAHDLSLPLTLDAQGPMSLQRKKLDVEDVALSLQLPVFKGASSAQILRLRQENGDEYVKFRAAVIAAIRERIERRRQENPERVALDVNREFIAPAIADINTRLKTAGRGLSSKVSFGATVGVVLTTVGVLTAMPLVIGAGVAAIAGTSIAIDKFMESKRQVELSDMYFLWLASRKLNSHRT